MTDLPSDEAMKAVASVRAMGSGGVWAAWGWVSAYLTATDEGRALVRDAERYRWLREHSWLDNSPGTPSIEFGAGFNQTAPEVLDHALDAAIAQREPKT